MSAAALRILNVGDGDTKITFDKASEADKIRAARIITDMLKRGYALLVEVEPGPPPKFQRVRAFDEEKFEYIIADLDTAAPPPTGADDGQSGAPEESDKRTPTGRRPYNTAKRRRLAAATTNAIAVGKTAGG